MPDAGERKPFRFGVTSGRVRARKPWRQFARKVENLGYSTLLVSDHFNDQLAPLPALAAAAEATSTLRVGTLVLDNDFKHPVVHAKELATIDLLSDGRLEWGMGAGWFPPDYESTGMAFDPPGVRVERLSEAITVMKALFADEPLTFDGKHYDIRGLYGTPKPVQRPHPSLLVGAARRRLLGIAARQADIVGIAPSPEARAILSSPPRFTPDVATDRQLDWIRAAARDRFAALELQMVAFPFLVTDDATRAFADLAANLAQDTEAVRVAPHVVVGSVDGIVEALEERRARWGVSYWVVPEGAVDAAAPVVERLAGR